MNMKENIETLKDSLKNAITEWANKKINTLGMQYPQVQAASTYLKRGLHNWIAREDETITRMLDNSLLFVADENGNVDLDMLVDDAVALFKNMNVVEKQVGPIKLLAGKGEVSIELPHNMLLDMLFGNLGRIRLTTDDLVEIKNFIQ